jgi:4-amino-4-deoxy-L-arabinose transferase-like glycosyltransferase
MAFFLYFFGLTAAGVLGPDEARYASIAREMARSGDWITPRLWGNPWYEKPPLLYWICAAAFRLGAGAELAPRLPVALCSVAFLAFYWWILRREFGCAVAWMSALILATSGGWLWYSQAGVTDIPAAAAFSSAMLLVLPWIAKRDTRLLPAASAVLGLAVLAKSLPPVALTLPLALRWRNLGDLLKPRVLAPFLIIALPWHVLCYLQNGSAFLKNLFWRQQFQRLTSEALMHSRPWWFYLPVLAGLLLPWTPLAPLLARRTQWADPRRRFLLFWSGWTLVFFSIAVNKLPGYVLPAFPAIAALMALGLAELPDAKLWLAACALLVVIYAAAAQVLPRAAAFGLSHAPHPVFSTLWLIPLAIAAAAWLLDSRRRRLAAVFAVAAPIAVAAAWLKGNAAGEFDRFATARPLWRQVESHAAETCVAAAPQPDAVQRNWRYSLNYYSVTPLPDCPAGGRGIEIRQLPGQSPEAVRTKP